VVTALDLLGLTEAPRLGSAPGSAKTVSGRNQKGIPALLDQPRYSPKHAKTPLKPLILPPSLDRGSNDSRGWISGEIGAPDGPPLAGWWGPSRPPAVALAFEFLDAGPALRRDLPALAAAADSDDADAFADAFGRAMAEHAANLPGLSA
jgi:hypothetical protein